MDLDKLAKLGKLKESGVLTDEEFAAEKAKIMAGKKTSLGFDEHKFGLGDTNYLVLMHLSQFLGILLPLFGIAIPIVLWYLHKDDPQVNQQGRIIINWNISMYIYLGISCILIFFLIGFFLLWIPLILHLIFPIIGAVKAKKGETWKYPFSIPFL